LTCSFICQGTKNGESEENSSSQVARFKLINSQISLFSSSLTRPTPFAINSCCYKTFVGTKFKRSWKLHQTKSRHCRQSL